MLILGIVVFLLSTGIIAYHRIKLKIWSSGLFLILLTYSIYGFYFNHIMQIKLSALWILFIILILPLNILSLRRKLISQKIFKFYQKIMPTMSRTEREALEAGTVSWEAELFNGKPNWKKLLSIPVVTLSQEEKSFILR